MELFGQYYREVEIEYKGESYIVREDGAVYRWHRVGRRKTRIDEHWTYGRLQEKNGYMYIGSEPVHIIVATAFIGKPPSEGSVVDHIDARKSNNRADNLRWISKLLNVIRHPSTRKKIIQYYGSLENFYINPGSVSKLPKDIDWLRNVSQEEAQRCREQLAEWGEAESRPTGEDIYHRIYGKTQIEYEITEPLIENDIQSLTPMAFQRRWKTPTEFPCCPAKLGLDPLAEYFRNLRDGAVFSKNRYGESSVIIMEQGNEFISVLSKLPEDSVKPWGVTRISIDYGRFIHESMGMFFDLNGAKKTHYELLGVSFNGESIDDFC